MYDYDEEQLVVDIACGQLTYDQIAERHGISHLTVGAIVRGERRPELQERINAASQGLIERARRMGAKMASKAMETLGTLTKGGKGIPADTRRKAAVDILKFTLGDPLRPEVNVSQSSNQAAQYPGLSGEELEAISKMRGGPA